MAAHREQLAAAAIDPFELVVVNLYPFAAAAERPGISFDDLVEEIDIGGASMGRAAGWGLGVWGLSQFSCQRKPVGPACRAGLGSWPL